MSETDRKAMFAAGVAKVPPKTLYIGLAVLAGIALLGVLGEDLFSKLGLNPVAGKPARVSRPPAGLTQLPASVSALMGITPLPATPAPAVALEDQYGRRVSLAAERGKVIVLTFFNSSCDDICPVIAAELAGAAADLGRLSARVVFLTVNTDALKTAVDTSVAAVRRTALGRLADWYLLGGSLPALDGIWRHYGVGVDVWPSLGAVSHNDTMYFVDPRGRLRYRAAPFANESRTGSFSLPPAEITRWSAGIASYVRQLLSPAAPAASPTA